MPFLTYDPLPQCLQPSPLTPLLLARGHQRGSRRYLSDVKCLPSSVFDPRSVIPLAINGTIAYWLREGAGSSRRRACPVVARDGRHELARDGGDAFAPAGPGRLARNPSAASGPG